MSKALQIAEETIDSGFQAIEALSDLVLAIDRSIFAQQRAEAIFSHVNTQLIQARRVIAVIEQRRKEPG